MKFELCGCVFSTSGEQKLFQGGDLKSLQLPVTEMKVVVKSS